MPPSPSVSTDPRHACDGPARADGQRLRAVVPAMHPVVPLRLRRAPPVIRPVLAKALGIARSWRPDAVPTLILTDRTTGFMLHFTFYSPRARQGMSVDEIQAGQLTATVPYAQDDPLPPLPDGLLDLPTAIAKAEAGIGRPVDVSNADLRWFFKHDRPTRPAWELSRGLDPTYVDAATGRLLPIDEIDDSIANYNAQAAKTAELWCQAFGPHPNREGVAGGSGSGTLDSFNRNPLGWTLYLQRLSRARTIDPSNTEVVKSCMSGSGC